MATILDAQREMENFFKKQLKKRGVMKEVTKIASGWRGFFEVLEVNELLLEKGFQVSDRKLYKIELDDKLHTTSYGVHSGTIQEAEEEG